MTTEAKLKKLEEDQIIMEDQNCKLAKVRLWAGSQGAVGSRESHWGGRRDGVRMSPSISRGWGGQVDAAGCLPGTCNVGGEHAE